MQDDTVRELVEQLRDASVGAGVANSKQQSEAHMRQLTGLIEALNERLGTVLRSLDQT